MQKKCPHPADRQIKTHHGAFCLECGEILEKVPTSKAATQKSKAHRTTVKPSSALISRHTSETLKPTVQVKVADITLRKHG